MTHYTQTSYLIAAQTVRDAICEDDKGDTKVYFILVKFFFFFPSLNI